MKSKKLSEMYIEMDTKMKDTSFVKFVAYKTCMLK